MSNAKIPKHINKNTSWPAPHVEVMRLAANVERLLTDATADTIDLMRSAHKYRRELAAFEQRDDPQNINENTKEHMGAWSHEVRMEDEIQEEGGGTFDPLEGVKMLSDVIDGCFVLTRAAQGMTLGDEISPWMFAGSTQKQRKYVAVREGQRQIEKAFLACIEDMAEYICEHSLCMAYDRDSEDPDEIKRLRDHNGMTFEEHILQMRHRIKKLTEFHDQYNFTNPFADDCGNLENYDAWLQRALLGKINEKYLRATVSGVIREQRQRVEAFEKHMDEVYARDDVGSDNVVKLHP